MNMSTMWRFLPWWASLSLDMCCESAERRKIKHLSDSEMKRLDLVIELRACDHVPEPPASACGPVKCWDPEREGWTLTAGAEGCRCPATSSCPTRCEPESGLHRSDTDGPLPAAAPAPGYSDHTHTHTDVRPSILNLYKENLLSNGSVNEVFLTVHGLTVSALLMNWNCRIPACWSFSSPSASTGVASMLLITHRWYPSTPQLWRHTQSCS